MLAASVLVKGYHACDDSDLVLCGCRWLRTSTYWVLVKGYHACDDSDHVLCGCRWRRTSTCWQPGCWSKGCRASCASRRPSFWNVGTQASGRQETEPSTKPKTQRLHPTDWHQAKGELLLPLHCLCDLCLSSHFLCALCLSPHCLCDLCLPPDCDLSSHCLCDLCLPPHCLCDLYLVCVTCKFLLIV